MIEIVVNYWAIIIAVVVTQILGFIWYLPNVFGNVWQKDLALPKEKMAEMKKKMGPNMGLFALISLISAYTLSHIIQFSMYTLGSTAIMAGVMSALWIWVGFVAPAQIGSVLWEGKPLRYFIINASYSLISYVVMGVIIAYWI